MAQLTITRGHQGVIALAQRGIGLDDAAIARIVNRNTHCECYLATPFSALAMRRFYGTVQGDDITVEAVVLRDALEAELNVNTPPDGAGISIDVPAAPGGLLAWPGALPPSDGYKLVETIPGATVQELITAGRQLARQFSTVVGPPRSLLSSPVITCTAGDTMVVIPMRVMFALNACSFVPSADAEPQTRRMRVAKANLWNRIEAYYGTIYWHDRMLGEQLGQPLA